jgi:hypothetical protein
MGFLKGATADTSASSALSLAALRQKYRYPSQASLFLQAWSFEPHQRLEALLVVPICSIDAGQN